jgi:signal transduction histidine kinase
MQNDSLQHQLRRWLWPETGWPPLLLPLVVAVIQVVGTSFAQENQPDRASLDPAAYGLLVGGPVALIWRDRYPAAVVAAVVGVTLLYLLLEYPYGPVFLSVVIALFTAIMAGRRVAAWAGAAGLYFGHFGAIYGLDQHVEPLGQYLAVAAWLLLVLVGSEVVRTRRDRSLATQRTREEEARSRASEERLRIARELHDVLAHHISLINVQAGVALHVMDRQPEQARTALTAIEAASREVLTEMRSVLSLLRRPEEAAPLSPASGLARLDGVVAQARAAGIEVNTNVQGAPRTLPGPIDAAAFRIVQEALTNVVRHAGARAANLGFEYGDDYLTIEVEDDGAGNPAGPFTNGGGSGIAGMRERVSALGGEFEAGPLPGRGFRVRARLPVGGAG